MLSKHDHMNSTVFVCFLIACFPLHSLPPQNVSGTTIIVRESPMGLFVGADSRVTSTDGTIAPFPLSKIITIGDSIIHFGAGVAGIHSVYNSYKIVDSCLIAGDSPAVTRQILAHKVISAKHIIAQYFNGDLTRFYEVYPENLLLEYIIVKRVRDNFNFYYSRFNIYMTGGDIEITTETSLRMNPNGILLMGHTEVIKSASVNFSGGTPEVIASKIYRGIELQCAHPNQYTGKPIRILWWNRTGQMRWFGDEAIYIPPFRRQ